MLKTGELIQRLRSVYAGGVPSDDTTLSARHAYHALLSARSLLIEQKVNKRYKLSDWMLQVLPCVELIKALPHECPCVPDMGCYILRTKFKLPKPISSIGGHKITSVSTIDGKERFSPTEFTTVKYESGNKYTFNKSRYYIHNGYLWVTNRNFLKSITIIGIFENIVEVKNFPSICPDNSDCPNCDCVSALDLDFPIEGALVEAMLEIAKKELIGELKQIPNDKINDSEDNK